MGEEYPFMFYVRCTPRASSCICFLSEVIDFNELSLASLSGADIRLSVTGHLIHSQDERRCVVLQLSCAMPHCVFENLVEYRLAASVSARERSPKQTLFTDFVSVFVAGLEQPVRHRDQTIAALESRCPFVVRPQRNRSEQCIVALQAFDRAVALQHECGGVSCIGVAH